MYVLINEQMTSLTHAPGRMYGWNNAYFLDLFTCVGSGMHPSPDLAVRDTHLERWMSESKNVELW